MANYLGLIPCEASSAEHWRLGRITKQGNKLLRLLLGQSAQSVARCEERWHRQYAHLSMRRNKLIAKVAMARKLAMRLFWMWCNGWKIAFSQQLTFSHSFRIAAHPLEIEWHS